MKKGTKRAIKIVAIIAVCLFIHLSIIFFSLHSEKDTEEYKAAQEYLVNSETFKQLGGDSSRVFMNKYSLNTYFCGEHGECFGTVTIGFWVKGRALEVICHEEDGEWQVCMDCTEFQ